MEFFLTTVLKLIPFLRVTILIAFTSMALGLIFGTLLAAMKLCPDSGVFIGLSDWCCGCDGTGKDY